MSQELSNKEISNALEKLKITPKTESSIKENSDNLDNALKTMILDTIDKLRGKKETPRYRFYFSFLIFCIFLIYSWLELLHFAIIVSIYMMMVNSVLHRKWEANWRQLNCNDIYDIYIYLQGHSAGIHFFVFALKIWRVS